MQLKLQRSQRSGGVLKSSVIFCLDARADYSAAEAANIAKYRLGSEVIYNSGAAKRHLERMDRQLDRAGGDSMREKAFGLAGGVASLTLAKMNLNISINSLGNGHHIECKDLGELLEAESALMDACRNLKQFLTAAATFNGSIILVDFDDGEKMHTSQGALTVPALPASNGDAEERTPEPEYFEHEHPPLIADEYPPLFATGPLSDDFKAFGAWLRELWADPLTAIETNPKFFFISGLLTASLFAILVGLGMWLL